MKQLLRRTIWFTLAATLAIGASARAEPPRIVVVLVEPSRKPDGFRATVGSVVAEDALALMTAMQAHCDRKNSDRGDRLVVLASPGVTLGVLGQIGGIASKPCHDARLMAYFTFDRKREQMWRFPQPKTGDPLVPFSTDPEAFRSLLLEERFAPAPHSR